MTLASNAAPTVDQIDEARMAPPVVVAVGVAEVVADDETSPSALATPPRSVLSSAQILRMPVTTEGRSS